MLVYKSWEIAISNMLVSCVVFKINVWPYTCCGLDVDCMFPTWIPYPYREVLSVLSLVNNLY